MKKYLFIATALAALASCSDNEFLGDNSPNGTNNPNETKAIVFSSGTKAVTRAEFTGETAANMLNKNFVFAGTKQTGTNATPTTFVFDQYNANWVANTANTTESNTNDWEYVGYTPASTSTLPAGSTQTIKYWDYSATQYDFAAYSLGEAIDHDNDASTDKATATASAINVANKSYTLTGTAEQLKNCYISDLVTAYNYKDPSGDNPQTSDLDFGKVVQLKFRSVASKIRMALYENIPGYSVKDVEFYTADNATETFHEESSSQVPNVPTLFTLGENKLPSGSGTMTITFPTTGWDNSPKKGNATDYNKAHIAFAPTNAQADVSTTLPFAALANFAAAEKFEGALPTGGWIGRASNAATYAGGLENGGGKYFTILPNETGANLKLRIKFKLVSTDGSGETITVDKATAVIPAELAKWQPNYAYTYIFKISDMTNGATGFDPDGKEVMGLTPITLNAVVVDSEDGVQETITTVSEPSITTYMAGKVVTKNDEYKAYDNHPIYIVVNDGSDNVELHAEDDNSAQTPVKTNAKLYTAVIQNPGNAVGSAINTISEESIDNALRYGVEGTIGDNPNTKNTYTVTDANGWKLIVTEEGVYDENNNSHGLTGDVKEIPAGESPTGNAVTLDCASFIPAASTTYVFQYKGDTDGKYGTYTAVAPKELTQDGEYYTYNESTGKYESFTVGTNQVIKVVGGENATVYYTKEADIYVPVTGALVAGTKYYYEDANDPSGWGEYTAYDDPHASMYYQIADPSGLTNGTAIWYQDTNNNDQWTSGTYSDSTPTNAKDNKIYTSVEATDLTAGVTYYYQNSQGLHQYEVAPNPAGGFYTKEDNYVRVPYAKLTKDGIYYTSNRGAGKFTATGAEEVDAENKYFTVGTPEVDGKYMYKVIKVVQ